MTKHWARLSRCFYTRHTNVPLIVLCHLRRWRSWCRVQSPVAPVRRRNRWSWTALASWVASFRTSLRTRTGEDSSGQQCPVLGGLGWVGTRKVLNSLSVICTSDCLTSPGFPYSMPTHSTETNSWSVKNKLFPHSSWSSSRRYCLIFPCRAGNVILQGKFNWVCVHEMTLLPFLSMNSR